MEAWMKGILQEKILFKLLQVTRQIALSHMLQAISDWPTNGPTNQQSALQNCVHATKNVDIKTRLQSITVVLPKKQENKLVSSYFGKKAAKNDATPVMAQKIHKE